MKKILFCLTVAMVVSLTFGHVAHTEQRAKQNITIISAGFGSAAYLMSQKLALEVNRNHPWLRITTVAGKPANIHELANKPKIRKNTAVIGPTFSEWLVRQGKRPAKGPYSGARSLGMYAGLLISPALTTDKNIKTLKDIKGKKINLFIKGSQTEYTITTLLKHIGIWDTIKPDYLGFKPGVDAIIDGVIDVVLGAASVVREEPLRIKAVPAYAMLLETRKCYVVDVPAEIQRKASKATGVPITPFRMPPGSLHKGVPAKEADTWSMHINWWVDESFPQEVSYELLKVFVQYMDELKKTSPPARSLSIEKLATADIPRDRYHPGALRFFKDNGIKVVEKK